MIRVIKFRFWKANTKEMITLKQALEYLVDVPILIEGKYNNFIPMQFTGLHDKNGVEIYEGDVLKEWSTHPLLVSIQQGHAYVTFFDFGCEVTELLFQKDIDEMELIAIGNKFENPELLEVPS